MDAQLRDTALGRALGPRHKGLHLAAPWKTGAIHSVPVSLLGRVGRASLIILIPPFCKLDYFYVPKMTLTRMGSSSAGRKSRRHWALLRAGVRRAGGTRTRQS